MNFLKLLFAFAEGFAVVVSPCILPILPIVLSAGVQGGSKRPYGLILGFVGCFSVFTLLSRKLVELLHVDPEFLRQASFVILIAFGLIMLSDWLSEKFAELTQGLAAWGQKLSSRPQAGKKEGFWSGVLVGCAIGLIWAPCAGPIMSAVIVQTIRAETDLQGVLITLFFSLGAALPMFLLSIYGKRLMSKLDFFKKHSLGVRRTFGAIIIATVIITAQGGFQNWESGIAGPPTGGGKPAKLMGGLASPYPAPELRGVTGWVNSKPLTIASLRGKVVLVDFWTYSCINCLRTLPYIISWDRKYRSQGLVILGVHSPEFQFEKNIDNVRRAVAEHGIQYPVALDSNLDTWVNFNNQYWPAHYLIDKQGRVVYTHFGEGDYAVTEQNIRTLLGVGSFTPKDKPMPEAEQTFSPNQTPETYLGYERAMHFASPQPEEADNLGNFTYPKTLPRHSWALSGQWYIDAEKIVAQQKNAGLRMHFHAKKVFLVLGVPPKKSVKVNLFLNGSPLPPVSVDHQTLYTLVSLPNTQDGIIELQATVPGLSAYAFTFGS